MLNQKRERKWALELVVKGIPQGAVPDRLVYFRSHQASAHTDFARIICLSPGLSALGTPANKRGDNPRKLPVPNDACFWP